MEGDRQTRTAAFVEPRPFFELYVLLSDKAESRSGKGNKKKRENRKSGHVGAHETCSRLARVLCTFFLLLYINVSTSTP